MKARGALLAAGAVLIALAVPAGASARGGAHRRHVEIIQPSAYGGVELGRDGGYKVGITFEEPDLAVLTVSKEGLARLSIEETRYGAHFRGSLTSGRVTADFGPVGSIALRFRPDGKVREHPVRKPCEGKPFRSEAGHWVGRVALHGEGGYFEISAGVAVGYREREFRLRCHFAKPLPQRAPPSLRERITPEFGNSLGSLLLGTISSLTAGIQEHGRGVAVRATHAIGRGPGSEVEALAFEYQGKMPVGRFVQILDAPKRSLVTTLPGEHPATATLKPGAPFTGEARYRAVSPTDHSLTGTLAVEFPGLVAPLTGPGFFSSLCVISPLKHPLGCDYVEPSWQSGEEAATEGRR